MCAKSMTVYPSGSTIFAYAGKARTAHTSLCTKKGSVEVEHKLYVCDD